MQKRKKKERKTENHHRHQTSVRIWLPRSFQEDFPPVAQRHIPPHNVIDALLHHVDRDGPYDAPAQQLRVDSIGERSAGRDLDARATDSACGIWAEEGARREGSLSRVSRERRAWAGGDRSVDGPEVDGWGPDSGFGGAIPLDVEDGGGFGGEDRG